MGAYWYVVMLSFHFRNGVPGAPADFIDGWIDGWMDGWDGRSTFFFGPYLENYFIIFLNCFSSLKYMFMHNFWNIRGKQSECLFFKIFRQNQRPPFFRKI